MQLLPFYQCVSLSQGISSAAHIASDAPHSRGFQRRQRCRAAARPAFVDDMMPIIRTAISRAVIGRTRRSSGRDSTVLQLNGIAKATVHRFPPFDGRLRVYGTVLLVANSLNRLHTADIHQTVIAEIHINLRKLSAMADQCG